MASAEAFRLSAWGYHKDFGPASPHLSSDCYLRVFRQGRPRPSLGENG